VLLGQVASVDISAYLRARGMEGYAFIDFDELNRFISLLRVRKSLCKTRILIVPDGSMLPVGVVSSLWSMEDVKSRFGINYKCVPSNEVFEEMDKVLHSKSEQKKADEITDRLIKEADRMHMEKKLLSFDRLISTLPLRIR